MVDKIRNKGEVEKIAPKPVEIKVGDYLAAPVTLLMQVVAITDGVDGKLYALAHLKDMGALAWWGPYEIEQVGLKVIVPDWHQFDDIKLGDVISGLNQQGQPEYRRVLARIDDVVL